MNFDNKKYKVYTWKNWMMLHWILNPGLAINELIFGQRVPKLSLEDKLSKKPRIERSYIPCPHCHTLHDARLWTTNNGLAFKNWFGLYCTSCGGIIPCLLNLWSFVLLMITFPIWIWFAKSAKAKWLKRQPQRYAHAQIDSHNPFDKKNWLLTGLSWGGLMFVFLGIIFPLLNGEVLNPPQLGTNLTVWIIGGLVFGYAMKWYFGSVGSKKKKSTSSSLI
jgi:hypothetical protein